MWGKDTCKLVLLWFPSELFLWIPEIIHTSSWGIRRVNWTESSSRSWFPTPSVMLLLISSDALILFWASFPHWDRYAFLMQLRNPGNIQQLHLQSSCVYWLHGGRGNIHHLPPSQAFLSCRDRPLCYTCKVVSKVVEAVWPRACSPFLFPLGLICVVLLSASKVSSDCCCPVITLIRSTNCPLLLFGTEKSASWTLKGIKGGWVN